MAKELGAPVPHLLALFNKAVRKINNALKHIQEVDAASLLDSEDRTKGGAEGKEMDVDRETLSDGKKGKKNRLSKGTREKKKVRPEDMVPLRESLAEDLDRGAAEVAQSMLNDNKSLLAGMDLSEFEIKGSEADWRKALEGSSTGATGGLLSVKKSEDKREVRKDSPPTYPWPGFFAEHFLVIPTLPSVALFSWASQIKRCVCVFCLAPLFAVSSSSRLHVGKPKTLYFLLFTTISHLIRFLSFLLRRTRTKSWRSFLRRNARGI